jgi:hypothetical protein
MLETGKSSLLALLLQSMHVLYSTIRTIKLTYLTTGKGLFCVMHQGVAVIGDALTK